MPSGDKLLGRVGGSRGDQEKAQPLGTAFRASPCARALQVGTRLAAKSCVPTPSQATLGSSWGPGVGRGGGGIQDTRVKGVMGRGGGCVEWGLRRGWGWGGWSRENPGAKAGKPAAMVWSWGEGPGPFLLERFSVQLYLCVRVKECVFLWNLCEFGVCTSVWVSVRMRKTYVGQSCRCVATWWWL